MLHASAHVTTGLRPPSMLTHLRPRCRHDIKSSRRGMPTQFVRRIVAVPIVLSLLRSAVLSSEVAPRSLFLLALGYWKQIKGNVPGFSTPLGRPSRQCVSAWGKKRDIETSDFSTTFPWGASRTGRQRILSLLGLWNGDTRPPALSRFLCDR